MENIVKVLLQEGIDEETIHEVLNVLEAELPSFVEDMYRRKENAEDFYRRKAEEEQKKQDEINAEIYAGRALRNLKRTLKGKKSNPPMIKK